MIGGIKMALVKRLLNGGWKNKRSLFLRLIFYFMIRKIIPIMLAVLFITSTVACADKVQLPKTGQTTKYAAGDDGDLRKGAAWRGPRFAVSNDCVTDNLTGLMWSKNGNMPNGTKTWQEALDYVASLNSRGGVCGYTDWRLPNVNELESLVNAEKSDTATWLNTQGFTNAQAGNYWSSSTYASDMDGGALVVGMDDSSVGGIYKSYNYYVWPVRAGQSKSLGNSVIWQTGQTTKYVAGDDGDIRKGTTWPSPRFTDKGNQMVKDNLTGLLWTKDANAPGPSACGTGTKKKWPQALDYVACLNKNNYLGHNDWRLPNRKELFSLVDRSKYKPALPTGHPFINVQQASNYWSSSTNANHTVLAWYVNMVTGYMFSETKSFFLNYVWPVRAGQ